MLSINRSVQSIVVQYSFSDYRPIIWIFLPIAPGYHYHKPFILNTSQLSATGLYILTNGSSFNTESHILNNTSCFSNVSKYKGNLDKHLPNSHIISLSQTRNWIPNIIGHSLSWFSQLRCEVIVCFVDIGRLVDNHCSIFSNNNKIANSNFINNVN